MCQESCECLSKQNEKQNEVYTDILSDVSLLKEQISLLEDIIKSVIKAEEKDLQTTQSPSTLKEMLLLKYLKSTYKEQQRMYIEKAKGALLGSLSLVNTVANSLNYLGLKLFTTQTPRTQRGMEN